MDVADSSGNVILRLNDGHIQTKNFNSIDCSAFDFDKDYPYIISQVYSERDESDFDLADSSGNVLVRFVNGHIKTKNFDSENIDSMNSSIISYIDAKDQEVLTSCLDQIDNISKTVDDCKNDVSVYKKEFDKLNSNFNILNNNVSVYKNSVTSLQEDYRSYKTQIETAFTDFKNNVNAENSSFREKFESYWSECEEVVKEAMNDLSLQIQTLDSSLNLAISDILSRLDALENKS